MENSFSRWNGKQIVNGYYAPLVQQLSDILAHYISVEDVDNLFTSPERVLQINGQATPICKGRLHIPLLPVPESTLQHTKKVLSSLTPTPAKRVRMDAPEEANNTPSTTIPQTTLISPRTPPAPSNWSPSYVDTTEPSAEMHCVGQEAGDAATSFVQVSTSPNDLLTTAELTRRFQLIEIEFQRSDARFTKLEHLCGNVAQSNVEINHQLKDLATLIGKLTEASPRLYKTTKIHQDGMDDNDALLLGTTAGECY
jgi:hypothetical protein